MYWYADVCFWSVRLGDQIISVFGLLLVCIFVSYFCIQNGMRQKQFKNDIVTFILCWWFEKVDTY